jgi:DNA-binding transcriptional MerR regulator
MELQTISQVSKNYGISLRTLRYYEEVGLIDSIRNNGNAYRFYDETALKRIHFIIILRKLRVSVKQIIDILNSQNASAAVEIFEQNISELDGEIESLSAVKAVLKRFASELREKADMQVQFDLLNDTAALSVIDSLSFSKNYINNVTENVTMDELNKAEQNLNRFEDKDIRIVCLPPMSIAAAVATGDGCEGTAAGMVKQFITESGLLKIKPDARSFGFDWSKGATGLGESSQAYQMWVSVPDDMEVPAPLVKLEFTGGLYAAHVLRNWDFGDWGRIKEWVNASGKYDNDWGKSRGGDSEVTGQGFEETLNFYNFIQEGGDLQLDLLFPIRKK